MRMKTNREVWYDNHMLVPGRYRICEEGALGCAPSPCNTHTHTLAHSLTHIHSPTHSAEEDLSCSNSVRDVDWSSDEHRRYFGVDVSIICRQPFPPRLYSLSSFASWSDWLTGAGAVEKGETEEARAS